MIPHNTRSKGDSLITAFTKRMSNRWQASATYTLSYFWDAENQPFSGLNIVPFKVQPDLGNEFTYASSDQRHRAVFSGIWEVARGFQLSGLHYFGAGIRSGYNYGGDLRGIGATAQARLRPNGTIVPRNGFIQPKQNKTDLRVQQRIPLHGRASIDLIADVFNLFNLENYTLVTQESAANFNKPSTGQFRSAQIGFRLTY
jgi:hypothetical protein